MTERGFRESPSGVPQDGTGTVQAIAAADPLPMPFDGLDFQAILQVADSLPVMVP